MIVLDTSVLSLALRRKRGQHQSNPVAKHLSALLRDHVPLLIPGIVSQEILSGVRLDEQFAALRQRLEAFPIVLADGDDHLKAAALVNRCRAEGIGLGTIDALIAAMTLRLEAVLFTLDRDFLPLVAIARLRLLEF